MFKPETHHRPPSTNPLVRQLRTQGNELQAMIDEIDGLAYTNE